MSSPISYRPDIDGLRAIAVGAVVIFHAFPTLLTGGFVGVDVFFVISGFLITSILLKNHLDGRLSLAKFYARRARRIFPALVLVLAACLAAGWFLLLPDEFATLGKHALAGAGFVSNIVLWQQSGYFEAESSRTILLHLWSLGIEEQFYLAWPFLLLASWRLRINPIWTTVAVIILSFGLNLWLIGPDPVATFYLPFTRVWELAIGALLAISGRTAHNRLVANTLSVAGLCAILAAAIILKETDAFPGWRAAVPTLGAAAFIAAGPGAFINRALSWRVPVFLGQISYPLYLWHWPLLVFPAIIFDGDVPAAWPAAAVVAAFMLSVATFFLVERPIRSDWRLFTKAGAASFALAAIAVVGASAFWSSGMPDRPTIAQYANAQAWLAQRTAWPYAENENCLNRFPSPQRREGWWFCMLENDAPPTVFLIGNSFANHLYPGIVEAPFFANDNVLQFGSCDPGLGLTFTYSQSHPCFGEGRQQQEEMVSRIIDENPTIRTAILSAPWPAFNEAGEAVDYFDPSKIDGEYRSAVPVVGETSYDAYMAALERRIDFLVSRGIDTTLVLMTPELGYDPETCYSGRPLVPSANTCQLSRSNELAKQARFRLGVDQIKKRFPTLRVFDPLPVFCDADICNMRGGRGPLLRDVGHLSVEGSLRLGAELARIF